MKSRRLFCLSIGGSIIVPDQVDVALVRRLAAFLRTGVRRGDRFVISLGGGALARERQAAARRAGVRDADALHRIGIAAAVDNAHFVREAFGSIADPKLYQDEVLPRTVRYPVTFVIPTKPGKTTDYGAVKSATHFHCDRLFNVTNVKQVYTKDPRKFRDAKPLQQLTWRQYWKFIPRRATPGLKTPFDPVASRWAAKAKLTVVILDGRNLANLRAALDGRKFVGTTIQS